MNLIDRWIDRFCDALALRTPDSMWLLHQPAVALVGHRQVMMLPHDRRQIYLAETKSDRQSHRKYAESAHHDRLADSSICNNSENCYLHGFPCACCGGSRTACPSGASPGSFWSFCCNNTMIQFQDCCGGVTCPNSCPFCQNSNQPNWCQGAPTMQYACTMTIGVGSC
jgi:hypothetical protein